jgi:hypothetical protein
MRSLRLAAVLVLAGALSGCFQTKTLVTLNADGSGTVEETVLMNSTLATTVMMGAAGMFGEDDAELPDGPYDEAALQARGEVMGASLSGVEPVRILFGDGYTATYAFDDINELQLFSDPDEMIPSDLGAGLFGSDDGFDEEWETEEVYEEDYDTGRDPKKAPEASDEMEDIVLDGEIIDEPAEAEMDWSAEEEAPSEPITFTYRDGRLTVHLPQPEASGAEEAEMADDEMQGAPSANEFRQMGLVLRDMRFSLAVEMPGEITETTARHASGRTLTLYDMDFGRVFSDPASFEALMALGMQGEPDLSREGMAQLSELPGILFESEREVTATFAQ